VGDQLHVPAALPRGEEPPTHNGQEPGWLVVVRAIPRHLNCHSQHSTFTYMNIHEHATWHPVSTSSELATLKFVTCQNRKPWVYTQHGGQDLCIYTPNANVPFVLPSMTRRATAEALKPASTEVNITYYINILSQAVRSRIEWFVLTCLILRAALGPGVYSASNRNEYQKQKNNVSVE
jgi:hypothetical protein